MRQKDHVSLGPQYGGSRVSRKALEDLSEDEDEDEVYDEDDLEEGEEEEEEEYDDPDLADLEADEAEASDSEIDSENALAESDAEHLNGFAFRGSSKSHMAKDRVDGRARAADWMSSDEDDTGGRAVAKRWEGSAEESGSAGGNSSEGKAIEDGSGGPGEEDSEGDSAASENHGEEGNSDERNKAPAPPFDSTRDALSNTADIQKGIAIQKQRKSYDALLNLRIRLQKALVAANTLPTVEQADSSQDEPYEAAEEAAIRLLDTISSLKLQLQGPSRAGEKRKFEFDANMSTEEIWDQLKKEEKLSIKSREERMEKWSRKVQSVNVAASRGLASRNRTLIDALKDQLEDPESRLVKRTRVPRSCAPVQAAKKLASDPSVYDDADFYQVLLKELVDQRTIESSSSSQGAGAVPSVMLTAAREAKSHRNVDRKASKGRKMRFTVHEKLQNFMAPEDRRTWEQGAIDRFLGGLFGRKMELDEDAAEAEEPSDVDVEEEGLRLFRS